MTVWGDGSGQDRKITLPMKEDPRVAEKRSWSLDRAIEIFRDVNGRALTDADLERVVALARKFEKYLLEG